VNTPTPAIQAFFDQYARSRSALDIYLIATQYPDSFMVAGPKGARVAEKTAVLAAFPRGQEFLKALGHTSTKVLAIDETGVDDHYVNRGALEIVFQHEHEEFQQALRASGVLPETT
jgi:hypothetical protein